MLPRAYFPSRGHLLWGQSPTLHPVAAVNEGSAAVHRTGSGPKTEQGKHAPFFSDASWQLFQEACLNGTWCFELIHSWTEDARLRDTCITHHSSVRAFDLRGWGGLPCSPSYADSELTVGAPVTSGEPWRAVTVLSKHVG